MKSVPAILLLLTCFTLSLFMPAGATNSDTAKESRWAEQVVDSLLDGDEAWLIDDLGHEFLGIFTEGDADSGHAVILMHGIGVHPNWPDVIYPLRVVSRRRWITSTMRATKKLPWWGTAWVPAWRYSTCRKPIPPRSIRWSLSA